MPTPDPAHPDPAHPDAAHPVPAHLDPTTDAPTSAPAPRPADPAGETPYGLEALRGRTFAAVLFDMDGTLIDSTPAVERSWATWAAEFDIDLARLHGWHGVPARGLVAHLLPEDVHDRAVARITELEVADIDGVMVLPGTLDALAALAPTGRAAIATSSSDVLAEVRLAAASVPRPAVVVTASDVERGKPAPDPYLLAAERLGVDPADCLVVEDAPAGLRSAKAAGCATLAVVTTTPAAELIANPDADAVVADLADVRFVADPDGVRLWARG